MRGFINSVRIQEQILVPVVSEDDIHIHRGFNRTERWRRRATLQSMGQDSRDEFVAVLARFWVVGWRDSRRVFVADGAVERPLSSVCLSSADRSGRRSLRCHRHRLLPSQVDTLYTSVCVVGGRRW